MTITNFVHFVHSARPRAGLTPMSNSQSATRVLHISTWNVPCGIATYCGNLVSALENLGVVNEVHSLQPHSWVDFLPQDVRRLGDEIIERARAFDVVHIQHEHGLFGVACGARAAARNYGTILGGLLSLGKPVVTTFHTAPLEQSGSLRLGNPYKVFKNWSRARTWRSRVVGHYRGERGLARAIVHTPSTRRAYVRSGLPVESVRLVPHGCLPPRQHQLTSARAKQLLGYDPDHTLLTIFGFVGRYKGHDVALHALASLPPEYHLAICGGAHPEARDRFFDSLLRKIDTLGLRDRVTITGWLSAEQAETYYAATDICLAPYREDCGLSASGAITWALSSGRPTIASKIEAFQAIQRESTAMLMTTAGRPDELAWAVERLSADPVTGARLVRAATAYCERNSWDFVARQAVDVYRDLLPDGAVRFNQPAPRPKPTLDEQIAATQSLEGWCSLDKARALAALVLDARPSCIAEIGVFGGRSAIPMALAARSYGGVVHGIDPWSTAAALEGDIGEGNRAWWSRLDMERVHRGFLAAIDTFGISHSLRVLRMTDTEALTRFENGQIDLLHVDGNHSNVVSRRYVEQWGPKLAPGGHLVLDDIDWDSQRDTVALVEQTFEPIRREASWAIYRKPLAVPDSQSRRTAA